MSRYYDLSLTIFALCGLGTALATQSVAATTSLEPAYAVTGDFDGDGVQDKARLEPNPGGMPIAFLLGDGKVSRVSTKTNVETLSRVSLKAVPSGSAFIDTQGESFRIQNDGILFTEAECCAAVYVLNKGEIVARYIAD